MLSYLFFEMVGSSSSLKNIPCWGFFWQVSNLCFCMAHFAFPAMIFACFMTDRSSRLWGRSIVRPSRNFSALLQIENKLALSSSWHFCNFGLILLLRKWAMRMLVLLKLSQIEINPLPPILLGCPIFNRFSIFNMIMSSLWISLSFISFIFFRRIDRLCKLQLFT